MPTDEAITPEGVESRFAEGGFVTTGEVATPLLQAITSEAPVRELVRRV